MTVLNRDIHVVWAQSADLIGVQSSPPLKFQLEAHSASEECHTFGGRSRRKTIVGNGAGSLEWARNEMPRSGRH